MRWYKLQNHYLFIYGFNPDSTIEAEMSDSKSQLCRESDRFHCHVLAPAVNFGA